MTDRPIVRSAHPVSDAMRATVLDTLADLERRHDVRVLFACESGSRGWGWGFASADSDDDVRFVDVNRLPWYLTLDEGRDDIERELVIAEAHSFARQPKADSAPLDAFLHHTVLHFDARSNDQNERERA